MHIAQYFRCKGKMWTVDFTLAVYLRVQTCGREAANPLHPFASPESERLAVSLKGAVLGSAELYVAIGYLVCGVLGFFWEF